MVPDKFGSWNRAEIRPLSPIRRAVLHKVLLGEQCYIGIQFPPTDIPSLSLLFVIYPCNLCNV